MRVEITGLDIKKLLTLLKSIPGDAINTGKVIAEGNRAYWDYGIDNKSIIIQNSQPQNKSQKAFSVDKMRDYLFESLAVK